MANASSFEPAYLRLAATGELSCRAVAARRMLERCELCPRMCGAQRFSGEAGKCRTFEKAVVCSVHPHFGEESPLVGRRGSGTIFFSWCNLHCRFCQNYELSAGGEGREVDAATLAGFMMELQRAGCHNINFVSPTHVVAQILETLTVAAESGLRIPLVYNTGGYDRIETLRLLEDVIDIYMPDMKYADAAIGRRLSQIDDYPEVNRAAVKEMHRQVGDLVLDEQGIAQRGLLVRHLVLPEGLAGTREVVKFLVDEISPNTYVNIMDQYRPAYQADAFPPLNRRVTRSEYREALQLARDAGLSRLDDRQARLVLSF